MLGTGKILFMGGENINGVSINNAELYNPSTGKFTATGNMTATRVEHTAVLLANGKVLVSGGNNQTVNGATPLASTELYNPATGKWSATGSMSNARAGHTSTVLHNGKVVNAGRQRRRQRTGQRRTVHAVDKYSLLSVPQADATVEMRWRLVFPQG